MALLYPADVQSWQSTLVARHDCKLSPMSVLEPPDDGAQDASPASGSKKPGVATLVRQPSYQVKTNARPAIRENRRERAGVSRPGNRGSDPVRSRRRRGAIS